MNRTRMIFGILGVWFVSQRTAAPELWLAIGVLAVYWRELNSLAERVYADVGEWHARKALAEDLHADVEAKHAWMARRKE